MDHSLRPLQSGAPSLGGSCAFPSAVAACCSHEKVIVGRISYWPERRGTVLKSQSKRTRSVRRAGSPRRRCYLWESERLGGLQSFLIEAMPNFPRSTAIVWVGDISVSRQRMRSRGRHLLDAVLQTLVY